jgi:hypothetical protein
MGTCAVCSNPLRGRQEKFCGRQCNNRYTNYHHQSYERQRQRGRERKLRLVSLLGGQCHACGYKRNYAALEFHHADPTEKLFQLDMRSLANLQWELLLQEAQKCRLLCSNCRAEHHNPDSTMTRSCVESPGAEYNSSRTWLVSAARIALSSSTPMVASADLVPPHND